MREPNPPIVPGRGEAALPSECTGTWVLETVNGVSLTSAHIERFSIQLLDTGEWTFEGELMERFWGMQLKGGGTWRVAGHQFQYSVASSTGESLIAIERGTLRFSPDPVIRDNGTYAAVTSYVRPSTVAADSGEGASAVGIVPEADVRFSGGT